MAAAAALAQLLDAAASGIQAGKGSSRAPVAELLGWVRPYYLALNHPEAPRAVQKQLGKNAAALREQQQRELLQQEQQQRPKQQQLLQQLLRAYAGASPACIELMQLLDACTSSLLQAQADGSRAVASGRPEGARPSAAHAKRQQPQQQGTETDEIEDSALAAQVAALLASAILTEVGLDGVPASSSTRQRLAAAVAAPPRLLAIGQVLLPLPAGKRGEHQHALLQLCLCRLLSAAAVCTAGAAWRVASAAQGATSTAAAVHGALSEGGEKETQQHPLNAAISGLCEGPFRRVLMLRGKRRNKADEESALGVLPPPPRAQGRLCLCKQCRECRRSAAAAAKSSNEAPTGWHCWHRAWGSMFVRCSCLACSGWTDPIARCPGCDEVKPKDGSAAALLKPEAGAKASAAAAAACVRATVETLRSREANDGLLGCGTVPIRYALRQEALRLLLVLLLHRDPLVSEALLRPRRRKQQTGAPRGPGEGGDGAASSNKRDDGVTLLRCAFRGLWTDRELDALYFLVGLHEGLEAARRGRAAGSAEAAERRILLTIGAGGFQAASLLQAFTSREDLQHLIQPLRSGGTAVDAASLLDRRRVVCSAPTSREPHGFFSGSWLLQQLLAHMLLSAATRSRQKVPSVASATEAGASLGDKSDSSATSPLLLLALSVRPLHLPPQQELLLMLFNAQPALVPHFLSRISGVLLSPRQSSTFALLCLFLCRILEAPWSSTSHHHQTQHQPAAGAYQGDSLCSESNRLRLMAAAVRERHATSNFAKLEREREEMKVEEEAPLFGDLERLRLLHAHRQFKDQEKLRRCRQATVLAAACVAPPSLLLRQHLTQCLLHVDPCVTFCGLLVLRACCQALRCMHKALKDDPELQRLLLVQAGLQLPDAKTLVNCLLRLIQRWQKQEEQQPESSAKADETTSAVAAKGGWPSDEAIARGATTAPVTEAKEKQRKKLEGVCVEGGGEASDENDDEVEIHVDGLGEAREDEFSGSEAATEETPDSATATLSTGNEVAVDVLLQLLLRMTSLGISVGKLQSSFARTGNQEDELESFAFCLPLLLGWIDTAEVYQELLTPSFPLDWGKLLCTWKANETEAQTFRLCCKWQRVATGFTRLGLQARGGVAAWGREVALGASLSKQQQHLLLHLLLQWKHQVDRFGETVTSKPRKENGRGDASSTESVSDEPLQKLLLFLQTSGLFLGGTYNCGLDEGAAWLAALAESTCFRCSAVYFVAILRLASERRLALLPYQKACAGAAVECVGTGDESHARGEGVSLFTATLLSHLAVTPRCNNKKALCVEFPPLGIMAPAGSCWGCSAMHSEDFCAESTTRWVVQGLMRCCILRPGGQLPLLDWLMADGPWRVLGFALNSGRCDAHRNGSKPQVLGMDAAREAAAQHPESKAINKCRKQLMQFLELSCPHFSGIAHEKKEKKSGTLATLDEQLKWLSAFLPLARDRINSSNVHQIPPETFLLVCAARLPGATAPSQGLVALAERTNCVGALRALTGYLQQAMKVEGLCGPEAMASNKTADEAICNRLFSVVLQMEAAGRFLTDSRSASYYSLDANLDASSAAVGLELASAKPVKRLFSLATSALKKLGTADWLLDQSNGFASSTLDTRTKRGQGACLAKALQHWVYLGAALCSHVANLCESTSAQVPQQRPCGQTIPQLSTAWLRLLRRVVAFVAAFARTEALLSPGVCAAMDMTACMWRLRLSAEAEGKTAKQQPSASQHQPSNQQVVSLRELMLCLLRRVAHATNHLQAEDGRRLLLLACEAVVCCKYKSAAEATPVVSGDCALPHLKWLLPLMKMAGVKCGVSGFEASEEPSGGLTPAEGQIALRVLLEACGVQATQARDSAKTVGLVQRLQALSSEDALQLLCVLDCLRDQKRSSDQLRRLSVQRLNGEAGVSIADEVASETLDGSVWVMVCLAFEFVSASTTQHTSNENTAGQDLLLGFKPPLVKALRALWDRSAAIRHACMSLFLEQAAPGETSGCLLHPGTRLALLLQWKDPLQDLPSSFYPFLVDAFQQCQENATLRGTADSKTAGKRGKVGSSQQQRGEVGLSRVWARETLEALKLLVYARDGSGTSGKRIRAKAAQWQLAATFLGPGWANDKPKIVAAEAPRLWAEGVQQFLLHYCVQQPGGPAAAHLSMQLARDLEEVATSLDKPFVITHGWPVDEWARFHAASVVLHATRCSGPVSSAAVRSLAAGRAGIGALLKDLKTDLMGLQEALQSLEQEGSSRYNAGEEGDVAAATDLAYFLRAIRRASQLGGVVLGAVQSGTFTGAGLSKEQRRFFKALRPKAQEVAHGFLNALAPTPPTDTVFQGAGALLTGPFKSDSTRGSLSAVLGADLLAVLAWVGLIVPAVELALSAAALEPSQDQIETSGERVAKQVLSSAALAALGHSAKKAARGAVSGAGDRPSSAAEVAMALMPLLQCLCEHILPACNGKKKYKHTAEVHKPNAKTDDDGAYDQHSCRLSETCPELFEALATLCGASTSCADTYICRILMLDSIQLRGDSHGSAVLGPQGGQSAHALNGIAGNADADGNFDAFSTDSLWMAHLPDFREVAEAIGSTVANGNGGCERQRIQISLAGPCEWLALDPRRVQDTLNNFAFHARAFEPASARTRNFGGIELRGLKVLEEMSSQQQRLLELALSARSSTEGTESPEEGTASQAGLSESRLTICLTDLKCAVESGGMLATTVWSSAYNVAYLVPYLAGRLSTACFCLLWRWQRLLETEKQYQQEACSHREEAANGTGESWAAGERTRPVCAAEQARRACGVAGAWLRSLVVAKKDVSDDAPASVAPEEVQIEADGALPEPAAENGEDKTSNTAANGAPTKRRREDVWEMDEFCPVEVQLAIVRVSSFLKTARRIGRFWRPSLPNRSVENEIDAGDEELSQRLEAWGITIDDGDQWLSSFASGGGLQLLIMALGCPDRQTRVAAAHGLAIYSHLLQLSADRSLLCHFAEVHEFNMQCRKRAMKADQKVSRRRELQQRQKVATLAFREVRQLLTVISSLMASIEPLSKTAADEVAVKSSQDINAPQVSQEFQIWYDLYTAVGYLLFVLAAVKGTLVVAGKLCAQALSPVVCSFAATAVPFLFLPTHPLYPLLNFTLLKHSAMSVLLHDPCMPLTLTATRHALLGSDGLFSSLLLSPTAATSAVQKTFLLLVLKRAMAASRCLDDGSVSLSLRLQAHMASQAVLPPPGVLSLSVFPLLACPTYKSALCRSVLEALLISTAAPPALSDCSFWTAHFAFRLVASQAVSCGFAASEINGDEQAMSSVLLPLATINAQHLLQRYGILQWIDAQLEAVFVSYASVAGHKNLERPAAREYIKLLSKPLPAPQLIARNVCRTTSPGQLGEGCKRFEVPSDLTTEMPTKLDTSRWLPVLMDCTRLMWSLIAASTLAAPLPAAVGSEQHLWRPGGQATDIEAQAQRLAAIILDSALYSISRTREARGTQSDVPLAEFELDRMAALWPLSTEGAAYSLCNAVLGARRQLLNLRKYVEREEEAGAAARPTSVQQAALGGFYSSRVKGGPGSLLWLQAQSARQLQLCLIQGIQRLARAWFAFGVVAGTFVSTGDGFCVAPSGCVENPALVAGLQQASIACVSALWAVLSCGRSLGLFAHANGSTDCSNIFLQQQQIQAAACCGDTLRLCAWEAAVYFHWSRNELQHEGHHLRSSALHSLWRRVLFNLCRKSSAVYGQAPQTAAEDIGRGRFILLALLQIKDVCGADALLEELIATAAGI